jgi:hypothetical protein
MDARHAVAMHACIENRRLLAVHERARLKPKRGITAIALAGLNQCTRGEEVRTFDASAAGRRKHRARSGFVLAMSIQAPL